MTISASTPGVDRTRANKHIYEFDDCEANGAGPDQTVAPPPTPVLPQGTDQLPHPTSTWPSLLPSSLSQRCTLRVFCQVS